MKEWHKISLSVLIAIAIIVAFFSLFYLVLQRPILLVVLGGIMVVLILTEIIYTNVFN